MKKAITLCCIVIIIIMSSISCSISDTELLIENDYLWRSEEGINYRIPGIIVTHNGTIIAYCEKRNGLGDRVSMDVVLKRSTDNGNTWSESYVLAAGIDAGMIIDNICMVVGEDNRIHCMYTPEVAKAINGGWIAYVYSDDDGVTWSKPQDISERTMPDNRGLLATGPGHGIALKDGTLIIPCWYSLNPGDNADSDAFPSVSCTIYSKNNGETWELGEPIIGTEEIPNPNENTIVQLDNGTILMNIRTTAICSLRAKANSLTGYSEWTNPVFDNELLSAVCFGSMIKVDNRLLFLSPEFVEENRGSRDKMLLRVSYDSGDTWPVCKVLYEHNGGYGDMNISPKDSRYFYVAQEHNENGTFSIRFLKVDINWLDQ